VSLTGVSYPMNTRDEPSRLTSSKRHQVDMPRLPRFTFVPRVLLIGDLEVVKGNQQRLVPVARIVKLLMRGEVLSKDSEGLRRPSYVNQYE